jgi:hypothetical protein
MVERRDVIGGGIAAGLAALFGGETAAQGAQTAQRAVSADDGVATAKAIDALREMFEHRHESPDIMQIRSQQRAFLKSNQKFPDFIDVGIDVWEHLHDWHVENRQPLAIVRMNDGHYGMAFLVTTLVLQPQQAAGYVSWGYDVK